MKTVRKTWNRRVADGYSVVELLVVIVLIFTLASLLIPVAKRTIALSLSNKCISNLKQIGNGLAAYAADNDGAIPPRYLGANRPDGAPKPPSNLRSWMSRLYNPGYIESENVFFCPSFTPKNSASARNEIQSGGAVDCYGMRNWSPPGTKYSEWAEEEKKLVTIENPSDFFLVADSYWSAWKSQGYGILPGIKAQAVHLRHANRANALFADGHVEAKPAEYFRELMETDRQAAYSGGNATKKGLEIFTVPEDPETTVP